MPPSGRPRMVAEWDIESIGGKPPSERVDAWSTRNVASMNDIDIDERRLRMVVEAMACHDRWRVRLGDAVSIAVRR